MDARDYLRPVSPLLRPSSAPGVSLDTIDPIVERMTALNEAAAGDVVNLGRGFRIEHSLLVPAAEAAVAGLAQERS